MNSGDIITALNSRDFKLAFHLIDEELKDDPKSIHLLYWKAQAYSIKAGVDIYSLFPILKMKLFEVAMDEWSKINQYSKRQQSKVATSILGENNSSDIESLLEDYERIKILEDSKIIFKVVDNYIYENIYDEEKPLYWCSANYSITSKLFPGKNERHWMNYWHPTPLTNCKIIYKKMTSHSFLSKTVRFVALDRILKKIEKIKDRKEREKYIQAIFALFDSVSLLSKVPYLEEASIKDIYSSIELLKLLKSQKEKRIAQNSKQQMGLLAAYLITGSLRNSILFENVKVPFDLICQLRPHLLINNYTPFRKGLLYLLDIADETDLVKKNENNIKDIERQIRSLPEELNEKEKKRYIKATQDVIDDMC